MSTETVGTLLMILVGSILGVVLGVLIVIGVIPLFNEGTKKKRASGSPACKDNAWRDSLGRPPTDASDRRPLS